MAQHKRKPVPEAPTIARVPNPNAAAIDVGGEAHFVAVPADRDPQPVRSFGPFTGDLAEMARWLTACRIDTVVLESTGHFWIPVYDALEAAGFEVVLVDPRTLTRHLRKKSDVIDCQWLQDLHAVGLLKGCFRPDDQVRALRTLWRHRCQLVIEAGKLLQRMQKVLIEMNVHLHLAVSDIAGATGMRIIRAIVKGERRPDRLAKLRDRNCKHDEAEIARALEGSWRDEHLFELKQFLRSWDFHRDQVGACDRQIAKVCGAFEDKSQGRPLPEESKRPEEDRNTPEFDGPAIIHRMTGVDLTAVDGLGTNTVLTVLSETGPDLSKWPTAKQFASGTKLAPRRDQSGQRIRSPSYPARGASRVAQAFRLAARGLWRSQSVLGHFLRRMKSRLGPASAIRATAHQLAKLFWRLMTTGESYRRGDVVAEEERHRQRRMRSLERQAKELGMRLSPA
jgi:transposase